MLFAPMQGGYVLTYKDVVSLLLGFTRYLLTEFPRNGL